MQRAVELRSPLEPGALLARLEGRVHPLEGEPRLVSKLSPGGAVIRVFRLPDTEHPFCGQVGSGSFTLVAVPPPERLSPFQPILRGRVRPDVGGSRVELDLETHHQVRSFPWLYAFFGVLLLLGAVMQLVTQEYIGAAGAGLLGGGFLLLPGFRARHGFQLSCQDSLAALRPLIEASPESA